MYGSLNNFNYYEDYIYLNNYNCKYALYKWLDKW